MRLTKEEITYLAEAFPEKNGLSLFYNISEALAGTEHQSLVKKGIIQGDGYDPQALEILMGLANPEICSRLRIQNKYFLMEKYAYRNQKKMLMAENSNGELLIKSPVNLNEVIDSLAQLFGNSKIKTTEFSRMLVKDELMVLLAIIDYYRKNILKSYLDDCEAVRSFSETDIFDEFDKPFTDGLVTLLKTNYDFAVPQKEKVTEILTALINEGCIVKDDGYALAEDYLMFAGNFLIPETVVSFETLQEAPDNQLAVAGGLCVTAGIHDILAFVFNGDTIEVTTLNGSQLLTMLAEVLSCPDLIGARQTTESQQEPLSGDTWQCSCGRINNTKFCVECGKKRS
jgi:hypothetical protein